MRWIQIERYKRRLWEVLVWRLGLWHFPPFPFLSLSSRLGGAGDILLTFRKRRFEFCVCERACVRAWAYACVFMCVPVKVQLCVCLSVVILHGSAHKSDYHKNTAENRLFDCAFSFPFVFSSENISSRTMCRTPMCLNINCYQSDVLWPVWP